MEFLIEKALQEKYQPEAVMEIGPGVDGAIKYLDLEKITRVAAIDFNQDVIDFINKKMPQVEATNLDLAAAADLGKLKGQWDFIISNSIVEHVIDDQKNADQMYDLLKPGGIIICTTVLHKRMYNFWDFAVGHYRRYGVEEFKGLFKKFSTVQMIKTSMAQEISRPLFFGRMSYLLNQTIEENNQLCGSEQEEWGRSPYAGIWGLLKYFMPAFLVLEWSKRSLFGGIGIIIAKK